MPRVSALKVPLRQHGVALISPEDAHLLDRKWTLINSGYVVTTTRPVKLLHREVLGLEVGDPREGDHINRNRRDNRRSNLRITTHAQNQQNLSPQKGKSSRYRGVTRHRNAWRVRVRFNYRFYSGGVFEDEHEAGRVAQELRASLMTHAID